MNDEPRQQGSTRTAENENVGRRAESGALGFRWLDPCWTVSTSAIFSHQVQQNHLLFSIKVLKTILSSLFGVKGQRYKKQVWIDGIIQSLSYLSINLLFMVA